MSEKRMIRRVFVVPVCFFAAIACYSFGVPAGGVIFIILGVLFEGLFWRGVFGARKKPTSK